MMSRRKRIGFFTAYPETTHVRRILPGVMKQCKQYDYDLCVFASSVHFSLPHENYVRGEANIFRLPDYDQLDGVILDSVSLNGDPGDAISKKLYANLFKHEQLPKCVLEYPVEGIHLIPNNNEEAIRDQCRHAIEVHGRKKICVLTGQKGNEIAEARLELYLDEIKKHGLEVLPEHVVYGDFYFFSGDELAKKIAGGEISRPDAVICASDLMAIGLVDRLDRLGIRVPEDILVIGYDCSDEGAVNPITLASYEPADMEMGANAVDYLRSIIEPEAELIPFKRDLSARFHPGMSCGCQMDPVSTMKSYRNSLYITNNNPADEERNGTIGLGIFMESYVMEGFTATRSSEECLQHICYYADLLRPFRHFYLCMKENWKNVEEDYYEGYPETMRILVSRSILEDFASFGDKTSVPVPTKDFVPFLTEKDESASVFYFSPVHFNGVLLGFTVLQRELTQPVIDIVYRNWLRYINNALEMSRSKERLEILSVRDTMTGAYNRRGMYERFRSMNAEAQEGSALLVCVVDMDGLKYVNDSFGHSEGDFSIKTVCNALTSVAAPDEICVRSGGDEFFLIGIGNYSREDEVEKARIFTETLARLSDASGKPYRISASIGCAVFDDCRQISLDAALSEADVRMYHYKVSNRRHRIV